VRRLRILIRVSGLMEAATTQLRRRNGAHWQNEGIRMLNGFADFMLITMRANF
jgi:hypothetical protein